VPPCSPMPIAVPWGAKRHDFKLVVIRVKSVVACPLKAVFDGEVPSPGHRHGQPSVRAEDGPSSGPSSTRSSASGKRPGSVGEAIRAVEVCSGWDDGGVGHVVAGVVACSRVCEAFCW
jgi:hypothetical protein